MGRSLILAIVVVAACSSSEADGGGTTMVAASTGNLDTGTSTTQDPTTPTTSISASEGDPTTTSESSSSSTGEGGSDSTSLSGGSSSGDGTTGAEMCKDLPTEGDYTECVQGFFCAGGGSCLEDEAQTFQVCTRGCVDECNCWATPEGDHTAVPACRDDILANGALTCVLDCSAGETCPTDMYCLAQFNICVFDPNATGTSSGTETAGTMG